MIQVVTMGRVATDVTVRQTANGNHVASYRIAVPRRFKREGQQDADFFNCVVFGKGADFAQNYLKKGTKILIHGELRNNNYQDKDGRLVYRDEIVVQNHEFCESRAASEQNAAQRTTQPQSQASTPTSAITTDEQGFLNIPDGIDDELPFQ